MQLAPLDDGSFAVTIPPDAPWFEGHFPGAPILPGVIQLGLVQQAAGRRIRRIERLRLRHPVGPGDELVIRLDGGRFVIRRDGRKIAEGELEFA